MSANRLPENRRTVIIFRAVVKPRVLALWILTGWIVTSMTADASWGREATTHENSGTPCALLENFGGDIEVLDPSRTRIVTLTKNSGIPCGGWVSTSNGWAIIQHRDGHDLRVGANSFLEIPENMNQDSDQVVLYRGEMFASTEGGAGELRVITANSRIRIKRGTAMIGFSPDEQDTQLVALEGPASLENRFEPEKRVQAKAGESTSLNFKTLRVVPTYPRAVSIASLRSKLGQFRINENVASKIYETAEARAERRLAADLSSGVAHVEAGTGSSHSTDESAEAPVDHPDEKVVGDRKIASSSDSPVKAGYSYMRNPVNTEQSQKLKAQWAKKMTAGEDVGEKILYPDKFYGRPQKVKVMISDPAEQMNAQRQKTEDVEKKRLIQELSQIRDE